jgi:ADP-ribosyl-[dinitrogen reductase] hydrolase
MNMSYEDSMKAMLIAGGDTDTNAAIIGGMLGAAVGLEGIP